MKENVPYVQKNPGVAAVLSFFWSGLGQIYNGQIVKGILLMVWQALNAALMAVFIGYLIYPIVWIFGIFDAYRTANKLNRKHIQ
ncbi:hypothetical protein [Bacillus sp. REN10]|uniref:hypothetical protein n=1 Tax=Bacillus sp. REN10 TaxID=2782541 RepID=UPI00193B7960|nr:hypothetical protein [Bacillus sp. REN10]